MPQQQPPTTETDSINSKAVSDIDNDKPLKSMPFYFYHIAFERPTCQSEPWKVSLYGKNDDSGTVLLELKQFRPRFYVSLSHDLFMSIVTFIEKNMKSNDRNRVFYALQSVTGRSSLMLDKTHQSGCNGVRLLEDYADTSLCNVLCVYVKGFDTIRVAVRLLLEEAYRHYLKRGEANKFGDSIRFYESNVDPVVHLHNTMRLRPCRWHLLSVGTNYGCVRMTATDPHNKSFSEIYQHICTLGRSAKDGYSIENLFTLMPDRNEHPKISVMAFDIECLSKDLNRFPTPETCPIIQISCVTTDDSIARSTTSLRERQAVGNHSKPLARHRYLFTVSTCDPIEGVDVREYNTEKDMLKSFVEFVSKEADPDMITGYNIDSFDLPFVFKRLEKLNVNAVLGRHFKNESTNEKLKNEKIYMDSWKELNLSGRLTHRTTIHGRILFDMYSHIVREYKFRSNKLGAVAEEVLKKTKDDVDYTEIPSLFDAGPKERARLGRYCVKDSELVLDLAETLQTFPNAYERCNVFYTTLDQLEHRGQQIRIMSMLFSRCLAKGLLLNDVHTPAPVLRELITNSQRLQLDIAASSRIEYQPCKRRRTDGKEKDILMTNNYLYDNVCNGNGINGSRKTNTNNTCWPYESPDSPELDDAVEWLGLPPLLVSAVESASTLDGYGQMTGRQVNYDGAHVLDPEVGLYKDSPTLTFDFRSLYPSIMIAYNLCFSTLVLAPEQDGDRLVALGMAQRTPMVFVRGVDKHVQHFFLLDKVKRGLLPELLDELMTERKRIQNRIIHESDSLSRNEMSTLDSQQAAIKIAANSVYGATGAASGRMYFIQIPASVTAYGREIIQSTAKFIETHYGTQAKVIYGDTDSAMVNVLKYRGGASDAWRCIAFGQQIADAVTHHLNKAPLLLQFESISCPFLLIGKKKYAQVILIGLDKVAKDLSLHEGEHCGSAVTSTKVGTVVENNEKQLSIDNLVVTASMKKHVRFVEKYKGLEVVRRDCCSYAINTQKQLISSVMAGSPVETILDQVRQAIRNLLTGKVGLRELVIGKQWKGDTKAATAHSTVVTKMKIRDPTTAPKHGDRVEYVLLRDDTKKRQCDRVEDPLYALEHDLEIDYETYARNQMLNQLTTVLSVVLKKNDETVKDMIWPKDVLPRKKPHFGGAKSLRFASRHPGNSAITNYFKSSTAMPTFLATPHLSSTTILSRSSTYSSTTEQNENIEKKIEENVLCLVTDIEDLYSKCMECKQKEIYAVSSCRNTQCDTLYQRYGLRKRCVETFGVANTVENQKANRPIIFRSDDKVKAWNVLCVKDKTEMFCNSIKVLCKIDVLPANTK